MDYRSQEQQINMNIPGAGYNSTVMGQIPSIPNVNIVRLIFIPTRTYNDVYRRPYEMNVTSESLNTLANVVGDTLNKQSRFNPLIIANTVPDIMTMSNVPKDRINIANGWNTVRLRFMMEVESPQGDATEISYIQGYTDYHDPSLTGRIDPRMRMHINSITNVIRSIVPSTGQLNTRVHSSFNVLYDPNINGYSIEDTTSQHMLIRPKDVVSGISMLETFDSSVNITNTRNMFGSLPHESKRLNSVGVNHVADVMNGYMQGRDMAGIGYDDSDIFNVASSELHENSLSRIPFIEALSGITNEVATVDFDLLTLSKIRPNIEDVIVMIDNSTPMFNQNPNNILDTDITERMDIVSVEATIATTISESVSSLLVDEALSVIDFSITNMTMNSEMIVAISNVRSFIQGLDVSIYADRFMNKFKALVMPGITKGNLVGVDIFVHVDILGETTIAVGLNGNPPVVYRLPTFCNSLYTSIVSDEQSYNVLVDDFSHVLKLVR